MIPGAECCWLHLWSFLHIFDVNGIKVLFQCLLISISSALLILHPIIIVSVVLYLLLTCMNHYIVHIHFSNGRIFYEYHNWSIVLTSSCNTSRHTASDMGVVYTVLHHKNDLHFATKQQPAFQKMRIKFRSW